MKLTRTYRFTIKTSFYITLLLALLMGVFLSVFYHLEVVPLIVFVLVCYFICFVIIQIRVERFIYRRVKNIYDDLKLLESANFTKESITTDMGTLTQEIDKYARNKKLEIETLKVREEYRKEFLGNVSHVAITVRPCHLLWSNSATLKDMQLYEKIVLVLV